jgi:hypothetical protein
MDASGVRRSANWTAAEDAVLADLFPERGVDACLRVLPKRTASAITGRVYHLGLRRLKGINGAPDKPIYDHRALSAALGEPAQPPGIPCPSWVTVHPCR